MEAARAACLRSIFRAAIAAGLALACGARAERSQFGMDFAVGWVSDDVELSVDVTAHRRP